MKTHVFDIDGTMLSLEGLKNVLEREFVGFVVDTDFIDYDIMVSVRAKGLDTKDFTSDEVYKRNTQEILRDTPLTPGFLEYLNKLKSQGTDIIFITARRPSEIASTEELFEEHGLHDETKTILYCGIEYSESIAVSVDKIMEEVKMQKLLSLGYDLSNIVLYEDRPKTCNAFAEKGAEVYLVDQVYNRNYKYISGVTVIKDFTELI